MNIDFLFFLAALILFITVCGCLWYLAETAWKWYHSDPERLLSWYVEMLSWWYTLRAIPTAFVLDLKWRRACLRHGYGLDPDQTTEELLRDLREADAQRSVR